MKQLTLKQICTQLGYKNVDAAGASLYVTARTLRNWLKADYQNTYDALKEAKVMIIHGDGVTDDSASLQHYANGGKVVYPDGREHPDSKKHIISKHIV